MKTLDSLILGHQGTSFRCPDVLNLSALLGVAQLLPGKTELGIVFPWVKLPWGPPSRSGPWCLWFLILFYSQDRGAQTGCGFGLPGGTFKNTDDWALAQPK